MVPLTCQPGASLFYFGWASWPSLNMVMQVFKAKGLRHLSAGLHLSMGTTFVPNDVELGGSSAPFIILTGPNMGGKPIYLQKSRQALRHRCMHQLSDLRVIPSICFARRALVLTLPSLPKEHSHSMTVLPDTLAALAASVIEPVPVETPRRASC